MNHIHELGLAHFRKYDDVLEARKKNAKLFFISPVFFSETFRHDPSLTIPCKIELSLEELRTVKDAKVELTFEP